MSPLQFQQFADPLPEPMLLVRGDGSVLAANRAVAKLRLKSLSLGGKALADVVSDSAAEVQHFIWLCSRSREMVLGALTIRSDENSGIHCRAEGAVVLPRTETTLATLLIRLLPKSDTVGQFLGLNEQISRLDKEVIRRRQTEHALRRQKEWLQVTLNSIGDAVIATCAQGRVVFMNPVAQAYLGWSETEVMGRPLTDIFCIFNEQSRKPVENPVSEVLRRGAVIGLANHTVLIDRNGHERPIEDSAAPIKDEHGDVLGVILVFHDVTRQRTAERELRQADRRKDEFLATLAHELRNPLAPIRNSLEILKLTNGRDVEVLQQTRLTMERQLSQMVRLIDDLLDVSRISRGKLNLNLDRVALGPVLQQAIETSHPLIESFCHHLIVHIPDEEVCVEGDSVRLCQVFSNLINNACKFTNRGGRIELTMTALIDTVEVAVTDNGVGISEEHLTSIFELFSQVDTTLERSHGGLGIGLTLVKQVLDLHHGSIDARSRGPGQGSQFVVRLPRATAE